MSVGDPSVLNFQCIISYQTFNNSSLVPATLLIHLQTNNNEYKDKHIEFFQRELAELNKGKKNLTS